MVLSVRSVESMLSITCLSLFPVFILFILRPSVVTAANSSLTIFSSELFVFNDISCVPCHITVRISSCLWSRLYNQNVYISLKTRSYSYGCIYVQFVCRYLTCKYQRMPKEKEKVSLLMWPGPGKRIKWGESY